VQRVPSGFLSALLGIQLGSRKALHLQTVLAGTGPLAPLGQDQVLSDVQVLACELVAGFLEGKELGDGMGWWGKERSEGLT
jgi:hypothetical protein